jgi:hypothetical protein
MGYESSKPDYPEDIGIKKRFITLYAYCFFLACLILFTSVQVSSNVLASKQEILSKIEVVCLLHEKR